MRSILLAALCAMFLAAPALSADSRRVGELQWIERRLAELQDDFAERLRQYERRLDRDAKVIEEVGIAIDALDSPQAYSGVEKAIEHLASAIEVASEEPGMPAGLMDALREGEREVRALRSNPTSPDRERVRHELHHTLVDPADAIIREDVGEASEVCLRIRRSLAQTEEKLDRVMKLRSRLVVGTVMPK
ncbi:MAG: hypothetical protein NDJ92_15900 [Thermoanaerobaculia bacterium]|nr:hypothetical protein [Thermoanaerobaculia bacterium]